MSLAIELLGETLVLRPDRTMYWPAKAMLILADPHFGKAETFRTAGVPLPGCSAEPLSRLTQAIRETGAGRLVVLGDFWHAHAGRTQQVLEMLEHWRTLHRQLVIEIVRGNHDRAGAPPLGWVAAWHPGPLVEFPFVFEHFPEPSDRGYVLAGHLHPGVELQGFGRQRLRLPCFRFGPQVAVLPAFGSLSGLSLMHGQINRTYAIADQDVIEIPQSN